MQGVPVTAFAGLDTGSVSVKAVVLDDTGRVLAAPYIRHAGRPLTAAAQLIRQLTDEYPGLTACMTGAAGKRVASVAGLAHVNELAALATAASRVLPGVRTVMEMGGEDAKLLLLDDGRLADFGLNSVCAAGTGAFLDQQAERMGLDIEDFAALALESERPPRIAGRCSVFAKSDMIHLQQIGTPLRDIAAGLCFAVARNFQGAIARGRDLPPPMALAGGVALNQGVARAFAEIFGQPELLVPELPAHLAAHGAALKARDEGLLRELAPIEDVDGQPYPSGRMSSRPSLGFVTLDDAPVQALKAPRNVQQPLYMGVDVGSISTNVAVIDAQGDLVARRYLRTASQPIEAVRQGLAEIEAELRQNLGEFTIGGVGSTGSGRYMTGDLIGADVVKNEITAQARAAVHIDPEVDTIFEIGGQDSKFISLDNGLIVDFEMNKACAAGTGSFLEEQAERLEVDITGEFARRACSAQTPCSLGERCTVFMDNALSSHLARGARQDDLLAGLAYAIVDNYLGRVVGNRRIGRRIFFQGGTAHNRAVVAAFRQHLDAEVSVPPHHDVTGALGMALIARDHAATRSGLSSFRGFSVARTAYEQTSFACHGCDNQCEINRVRVDGRQQDMIYGGRCEKWDVRRRKAAQAKPDAFKLRLEALYAAHEERAAAHMAAAKPAPRGTMGLPLAFFAHDFLPYFATLLWELGFEVLASPPTTPSITRLGASAVLADTCYPVKAAQGHVRWLAQQGARTVFLPSVINLSQPEDVFPTSLACPLTQSFPYQVRAAMPELNVMAPEIILRHGQGFVLGKLKQALAGFGVSGGELKRAMRAAALEQARFAQTLRDEGRRILDEHDGRILVLLGRAYNAFDPGMNLGIPAKLASLGEVCLPMDMLPDDAMDMNSVRDRWPNMYWRSGQRLLAAALAATRDPRLTPVIVGNFSCGPDSFIHKHLDEALAHHPSLSIEIDEHSADAGVVTRLEAFLDSLHSRQGRHPEPKAPVARPKTVSRNVTVYVPRMSDHSLAIVAAFRACGLDSRIMENSDARGVELARARMSGKECYPCAVTAGDMLKLASRPDFDPGASAIFMPSGTGPCRFGQYHVFHRAMLDQAGFPQVPILSPEQSEAMYAELGVVGTAFSRTAWDGIVAVDLLLKCLHETRPLESEPGRTQAVYDSNLHDVIEALAGGSRDIRPLLNQARADFQTIERTPGEKPLIGIVGEIFVRANRFSNEELVLAVEALGGRAWLAPCDEWISYVGEMSRVRAWRNRDLKKLLPLQIKAAVQKHAAHKLEEVFKGFLHTAPEPQVKRVLELAEPYVKPSFEGEAILSVGKAVHMCRSGAAGLINAMPFGCMPGTVAAALLTPIARDYGVPLANLTFDGSPSPVTSLTLEAFMDQVRG